MALADFDGLQSRQPMEAAGFAHENRGLILDQLAVAAGEDGQPSGGTCAPLLAFTDKRASDSEAIWQHAKNDRGVAAAGRLPKKAIKQTSARKTSYGEVSAARQTGAAKTRAAAVQNGQNDPRCHPQRGQGDLR
jgi:hypothetical protein